MKQKESRKLDIIYYLVLNLFVLFSILNNKLDNMDEVWSFLFAKNISVGLIPYKDFNIIVTPLSIFINGMLLVVKPTLFIFRILYFFYFLIMIYLLDRIANKLKIKPILKYLLIFVSIWLLLFSGYLDYNFIQLILILLLVYLSLKSKKYNNKKISIAISIIAGLTIVNKQSTGLIICFITIILMYFEKKQNLKFVLKQIAIMLIPSILFVIYLLLSESFFDFYDLCILGLTTFSNKLVLPALVMILIVGYGAATILLQKYRNKELIIIFCYALASLFVVIPIVDLMHTILALIILLIFFTYIIDKKLKVISDNFIYVLIGMLIILNIINICSFASSTRIKTGVYKNIPADTKLIENITNVKQFVLSKSENYQVYILDFTASLYELDMNRYNKYFSLFMNGNFGVKGERKIYNTLNQKNQIVLINSEEDNWQRPQMIVDYVKKTYIKCGKIEQFDVYCN